MDRTVGSVARWTRAGLLGAVATALGTTAHVAAGGLFPPLPVTLALLLAVSSVAAATLGRPASTLRIALLLMAGQAFIHGVMTAWTGHPGSPSAHSAAGHAAHVHAHASAGGHAAGAPSELPLPLQHLVDDLSGPNALMALAHLAAAALVGAWLAVGERSLWSVVHLLAASAAPVVRSIGVALSAQALPRPAQPGLSGPTGSHPLSSGPPLLRTSQLLLDGALGRRGPPVLITFGVLAR